MSDIKATISLPPRIAEQVEDQIREGWFTDLNSLVVEALRRFLETRSTEITEHWIREDIEWGLRGEE